MTDYDDSPSLSPSTSPSRIPKTKAYKNLPAIELTGGNEDGSAIADAALNQISPVVAFSRESSWSSHCSPVQPKRKFSDGTSVLDSLSPRGVEKVCSIRSRHI